MTIESVADGAATKQRKFPYLIGIVTAMLGYGLSLLEPSIRGPKLWAIFSCASFAVWVSVLKLRNIIHGTGWVFPRTNTSMLAAIVAEVWLHLWFSH
jgi:hypothetical protein